MSTHKQDAKRIASDAADHLACHMLANDAITALLAVLIFGVTAAVAWWVAR